MNIYGEVGPQGSADGVNQVVRQGRTGELIMQQLHGRYFEQAFRQALCSAATQAGQTTSAGLSTTYVGLCLSNPIGNTKNLSILKIGWAWSVIAAAVNAVGLAVGYNPSTNVTHTTPVAPISNLYGTGPTPTAKADVSATLPTAPVYLMFLDNTPTATTNPKGGVIDLEGSIIIPPGGYICTVTSAASSAAAFWASMMWEEVPLLQST